MTGKPRTLYIEVPSRVFDIKKRTPVFSYNFKRALCILCFVTFQISSNFMIYAFDEPLLVIFVLFDIKILSMKKQVV